MSLPDRRLERGLAQLERLIAEADAQGDERARNEASTRFHVIDSLLLNVLAWPRDQVEPEEYSAPGFADYVLGRPHRQLVVEAKREGIAFDLPPETPLIAAFNTLFTLAPDLKPAVEQAQRYASSFGLPYAAVCNGHQLVAFLATRIDGVAPLKGKALAFPSFAAMKAGFAHLWDGLSQPGVESRRLSALLAGESAAAPPAKVSTIIPGYPGQVRVTSLHTDLRMLGELFLIDMPEQPALADEFLRECYLPSGALSQHAAVGRDILRSRYSEPLAEDLGVSIKPARTKRGVTKELIADVAKASLSSRPIILLGYVGVGKTMFVRHLVRVDAKDVLANAIVLYVDLGGEPALEHLTTFVTDHFLTELQRTYDINVHDRDFAARVYTDDLAAFERGPYGAIAESHPAEYKLKQVEYLAELMGNNESHLRRCLEHIANVYRRQIVTILDNVDQRPASVQDEVFLLAATLARSWPGTVFISLRPDTFNRSRRSGTLSAYQPRVFAVAPPRIDRVLEKRIRFAQSQLERAKDVAPLRDIGDTAPLNRYLEIIRLSLRRSRALAELVDNLSGQNARRAVELLTTVLSSPHARPDLAVRAARPERFSIPFHRFLKALMLGDGERVRSRRIARYKPT